MIDKLNKPKVSIIIPVYNVKPYVAEALDSVINQTYKNLEIIVVDDGSDDGSEKICDEYAEKDDRIKLIHQQNRGLSAARNTGLDNITGEYVCFLDSDDTFFSDTVEKSLNAIIDNDVDCVVFKVIRCKTHKNGNLKKLLSSDVYPKISQGVYSRKEALKAVADRRMNFSVWNKLYKSNIFDTICFPEGYVYEDVYTVFQIFDKMNKIFVLDDVLVMYRKRQESISLTVSAKNIQDNYYVWTKFYNYIETHTPEVFDSEQLQKTREKKFNSLVLDYAEILSSKSPEKNEVLSLIKEQIKDYEKSVEVNNCRAEIRLVCYMMFNHPKLLSIFFIPCYNVYKVLKRIAKNFFTCFKSCMR